MQSMWVYTLGQHFALAILQVEYGGSVTFWLRAKNVSAKMSVLKFKTGSNTSILASHHQRTRAALCLIKL